MRRASPPRVAAHTHRCTRDHARRRSSVPRWGQCPANRVQDGGVRAGDTEFTAQGAPGLSGMVQTRGRGGGRGLHPTPPRSQAEPKLGGSGGLPAARSPPRGPRRPRDSPGGGAHSPPVARRTIPLPSTFGGRGPRAWAALATELTPPERGFASSPLPRLVVSGAPRRAWCALNKRSQCRGGRRRGAGANPLVPCGVNVSKHNRFVYRSRVLNLSKFTSKCDGCLCVSLLSVRAQSSVSE